MVRFAHYDAREPVEEALCISAFVVSRTDAGVLVGQMKDVEAWSSLDRVARDLRIFQNRWVLPASHLVEAEDPGDAVRRIVREQLLGTLQEATLARVLSHAYGAPERDQELHWDLCFVYEVDVEVPDTPPWFSVLRRLPLDDLARVRFARGHGDILREMGLPSPPEPPS